MIGKLRGFTTASVPGARLRAHGVVVLAALLLIAVPLHGVAHGHSAQEPLSIGAIDQASSSSAPCPICRIAHERAVDVPPALEPGTLDLTGAVSRPASPSREGGCSFPRTSRAPPAAA